jgi:hypothetical protein
LIQWSVVVRECTRTSKHTHSLPLIHSLRQRSSNDTTASLDYKKVRGGTFACAKCDVASVYWCLLVEACRVQVASKQASTHPRTHARTNGRTGWARVANRPVLGHAHVKVVANLAVALQLRDTTARGGYNDMPRQWRQCMTSGNHEHRKMRGDDAQWSAPAAAAASTSDTCERDATTKM